MSLQQEIKVPLLAVNDTSLTVVEMNFKNGDHIRKGDIVLVFETSKTTYDVPSESEGYIQYVCTIGHDYEVNDIVAKIYSEKSEIADIDAPEPSPAVDQVRETLAKHLPEIKWEGDTVFSAEADQLIQARNLDRTMFIGKDLVSKHDVEAMLGITTTVAPRPEAKKTTSASKPKPAISIDHSKVIVERLSAGKKREIEYLGDVQSTGLTSTINTFVETDGIFVHANQSLKYLKNSLLPLVIYETARLLKKFPVLNAYFAGEGIAIYNAVNVGFAADMGQGLKVLKISAANEKSIGEIESDIMNLSDRYLENNLTVDDLTEITFTITDLSAEQVSFFRPLVNMMNSAILGISAIDEKLQRCTLSVTFDHRVTEGRPVAQFLQQLKERLESYRGQVNIATHDISCNKCSKSLSEDLGQTGFIKCITPEGKEGYICQSCLKGF